MKYDGFESNGNNSSRAAFMLGGASYNGEFSSFGEEGRYFTGTEYSDTKNVIVYTKKSENFAKKNVSNNTARYPVKFTIEPNN